MGREDELAALAPGGPGSELVVLAGDCGSGRTTLLAEAAAEGRAAGRLVLGIDPTDRDADWDEYGVGALLAAVRSRFEALPADGDLMRRTSGLGRRHGAPAYRSAAQRALLHREMQRLLLGLGPEPALVVIDDSDHVPDPEPLAVAARSAGHRVLAVTTGSSPLHDMADVVVRVAPIADGRVEDLLRRILRRHPDPVLVRTVEEALGPLAGNPSHLRALIEELRRTGRLVTVGGRVCLREPDRMPMLPPDSPEVEAVGEPGGPAEAVALLADGPAGLRVDDVPLLADALGLSVLQTGRTVDQLVHAGTLGETDGELVVRAPAVGAALRERTREDTVHHLHAAVVRAAVGGSSTVLGDEVLADHVAAAGPCLEPDPRWAVLLSTHARRRDADEPGRGADLLRAADRHHDDRTGCSEWELRLLLRAGEHERILRIVGATVERRPGTVAGDRPRRSFLAAVGAVAALTLRRSPPALGPDPATGGAAPDPLSLARLWSEGESVHARDLDAAVAVLAGARPGDAMSDPVVARTVERALAARDIVGALGLLLGPAYGEPADSPIVLVYRVSEDYRAGRWDDALAAARAVVTDTVSDEDGRELCALVALFAADIATWRGEERTVETWLEYAAGDEDGSRPPLLDATVRVGRLWLAGDGEAALRHGWRAWTSTGPEIALLGRRALLTRLCGIAAVEGRERWLDRLRDAAEDWWRSARGAEIADAEETRDLVRGVLGGAGSPVLEEVVGRIRDRGHGAELGWVLLAAGAAGADPETNWSEAYAIATEIGAPVLRARLRGLMEQQGLRPLATRTGPHELTDLQWRIVELVEQGRTNRQISREVRLSEKTIENHLTRLFTRFGCRTRHGLAAARLSERRGGRDAGSG